MEFIIDCPVCSAEMKVGPVDRRKLSGLYDRYIKVCQACNTEVMFTENSGGLTPCRWHTAPPFNTTTNTNNIS